MEEKFTEHCQERAVLVGLNAACFTKEQTATDESQIGRASCRERV